MYVYIYTQTFMRKFDTHWKNVLVPTHHHQSNIIVGLGFAGKLPKTQNQGQTTATN